MSFERTSFERTIFSEWQFSNYQVHRLSNIAIINFSESYVSATYLYFVDYNLSDCQFSETFHRPVTVDFFFCERMRTNVSGISHGYPVLDGGCRSFKGQALSSNFNATFVKNSNGSISPPPPNPPCSLSIMVTKRLFRDQYCFCFFREIAPLEFGSAPHVVKFVLAPSTVRMSRYLGEVPET